MIKKKQPRAAGTPPSEHTRAALIHAGLKLFGSRGYDGTSTRDIAAEAKANIGSIAYHFGSKEGLRSACAEHIVQTIRGVAGSVLDFGSDARAMTPDEARARIERALETMVTFIVARPESGEFVQFLLRELAQPTPALDVIYNGIFLPMHTRLCRIWEDLTGEPVESDRTKLTIFTLIGQVLYFRVGRLAVLRRMGWTSIGEAEAAAILSVARDNLGAIVASRKDTP